MAADTVDRRFNLARPDLVGHTHTPAAHSVTVDQTPLRCTPDGALDDILLRGEAFEVHHSNADGWSWGQTLADRYVGYVRTQDLHPETSNGVTHRITALSSHLYTAPDIKSAVTGQLFMGSPVRTTQEVEGFLCTAKGYIPKQHVQRTKADFVDIAQRFTGTPYLWGGRSIRGIDCSGLVQMALRAVTVQAPRDSDLQAHLGQPVEHPQRGDLVFWAGHVGIMIDAQQLLHANAHHMSVQMETLESACVRIAPMYGEITTIRRLK